MIKTIGKIFGFAVIGMFGWLVIASVAFIASEESPAVAVDNSMRDGKFEFDVNNLKCGVYSYGVFEEKPLDQFCLLNVTITNIGEAAQDINNDQFLYDINNKRYSTSNDVFDIVYEELNPGQSVTGNFIFDVPLNFKVSHVILHEGYFSDGIKVNLNN
jgi:hypothetical protein